MTAAANGGEVADIDAALDDGDEGRLVRLVGAMVMVFLFCGGRLCLAGRRETRP